MPTVNLAMIGATLFAQSTVICAGFFTELPLFIGWFRYISPIFYAFKGIVKTAYNWDDTYQCPKGSSAVGSTECFVEFSPLIDDYEQRGINVATYGDPSSSHVYLEIIMMFLLFTLCQFLVYCYFKLVSWRTAQGNDTKVVHTILLTRHDTKYDSDDISTGSSTFNKNAHVERSAVSESERNPNYEDKDIESNDSYYHGKENRPPSLAPDLTNLIQHK